MKRIPALRRVIPLGLAVVLLGGCFPWAGWTPPMEGSVNRSSFGLLLNPERLPAQSDYFRFYNKGDRPYGVPQLIELIAHSAKTVADTFAGSVLLVGDLSASSGGKISGHSSHRTGRDVDFGFYVTDGADGFAEGFPLVCFDRFGVSARGGRALVFDRARNWHLVEALLTDQRAQVQWIFVSDGLKALLLEWALANGRDVEIIRRAASVLHQPGDSLPHDDHFHVRIYCPADATGDYCVDQNPIWPWVKPATPEDAGYTDDVLTDLAIGDLS
jgi:penicillin-insensitive murein endopeptidase